MLKLHDKNPKILLKSLAMCSVKLYSSTLLKSEFNKFQLILYCYNVGNMCKITMFILSPRYHLFVSKTDAKHIFFYNFFLFSHFVKTHHFIIHHPVKCCLQIKEDIY